MWNSRQKWFGDAVSHGMTGMKTRLLGLFCANIIWLNEGHLVEIATLRVSLANSTIFHRTAIGSRRAIFAFILSPAMLF
jgi:hypothetical protein